MGFDALKLSQRFKGVSKNTYQLLEQASTWHSHALVAQSEIDGRLVLFKSPLRPEPDDQARAMRQLSNEMTLLCGPLKGVEGVRQMIDTVNLARSDQHPADNDNDNDLQAGVFEYLENDMHKFHMTEKKSFSLDQIKTCTRQLLMGLSHVHKKDIIHTDLKMENMAFSTRKTKTKRHFWQVNSSDTTSLLFKILDFGVAASVPEDRHRTITNPYWRSPESWLSLSWGSPADVWSLGAIISSLLMEPGAKLLQTIGNPGREVPTEERDLESIRGLWTLVPFPPSLVSRVSPELQEEIAEFKPKVAPNGQPITLSFIGEMFNADKGGWDFVTAAMEPEPEKRPTAEKLLQHPWLRL